MHEGDWVFNINSSQGTLYTVINGCLATVRQESFVALQ